MVFKLYQQVGKNYEPASSEIRKFMKYPVLLLFILTGCSTGHEVVMPFKNLGYSGERLLPVRASTTQYSLRIWINNSTSIDRVISISKDSLEDFKGYLAEIGELINGKKTRQFFRQIQIIPKSGFELFKNKIDTINLLSLTTQPELLPLPLHQPFSTYVIEIKDHNKFNNFQFDTYYPNKAETEINEKYAAIQKLIFDEFDLKQYFKFKE
jgi:hypothetical protein